MSRQKTILGLVASPRKLGNCEIFLKEVWRHVPGEWTLTLLRLTDLDISPCRACYACIMGGECPLTDHIAFLKGQILSADAFLIAAPVYFLGTHSAVKRILDRAFLFYEDAERNARKPCILINLFGMHEKMGVAPQTLRALAGVLCLDVRASINLMAALPGEVLREQRNIRLAEKLGGLLFSRENKRSDEGCPYCGCEIVRMQGGELICTLCHGTFTFDAEGKRLKVRAGWEIGTVRFVREHSAWLKGMKDKYVASRKELLRLTLPYKDIGTWVEPPPVDSGQ